MATPGRATIMLDVDLDRVMRRLRGPDFSPLFGVLSLLGRRPRIVEAWDQPIDRWDDDGGAQHAPRAWGSREPSAAMPWLSRQQRRYAARQAAKKAR